MGIATRAIEGFAKSKMGTKLYKWAASEKGQQFLYKQLPNIESVVSVGLYCLATERQKNLSRREKNVLQWQNILPGVIGISLGAYLNNKVYKFGESIMKYINPDRVKDVHKIRGALAVLLPLGMTATIMRFAAPTITAFISGEVEERRNKKKKLDVKA